MGVWVILLAVGLPTAFTGFCFWLLQRRIAKGQQREEERDKARQENEVLTLKSINASIALGEAAAMAIKNGHANGETEAALKYAREIKHEQKDFLTRQGVKNIYGGSK